MLNPPIPLTLKFSTARLVQTEGLSALNKLNLSAFSQIFKEKVERGLIFNGPSILVRGIDCGPNGCGISVFESDYVTSQAVSKANVTNDLTFDSAKNSICGGLGVETCVISNDAKILVHTRSLHALTFPGHLAFAFGEGLEPKDLSPDDDSLQSALIKASVRCLREELALDIGMNLPLLQRLSLHHFAFEQIFKNWVGYVTLDLRGAGESFDATQLIAKAKLASDSWEIGNLRALNNSEARNLMASSSLFTPSGGLFCGLLG